MLLSSKTLYISGTRKLRVRYVGPFSIIECIRRTAYRLDLKGRFKQVHNVFHVSHMKKHIPGNSSTTPPELIQVEGEDHFEVEAPLKHRSLGNSWQYLVRWLGYGPEYNEWVYKEELTDGAEAVLKKYKDMHGLHSCCCYS